VAGNYVIQRIYRVPSVRSYMLKRLRRGRWSSSGWSCVRDPAEATRYFSKEAAEAVAFTMRIQEIACDWTYEVVRLDWIKR
jgi:hypothetical protein